MRADPLANVDFFAFKQWRFMERRSVEFRGEFLISQRHHFQTPDSLLGTSVFGTVTAVRNSGRQVQLALKQHL